MVLAVRQISTRLAAVLRPHEAAVLASREDHLLLRRRPGLGSVRAAKVRAAEQRPLSCKAMEVPGGDGGNHRA